MSPILSQEELVDLTGGYVRPSDQLRELHKAGYVRARRSALTGKIILERAHQEAVAAGHEKHSRGRVATLEP